MKKIIKHIAYAAFAALTVSLNACYNDIPDELTALDTYRLFSPTGFTIKQADKVEADLTWETVDFADSYTVEAYETNDYTGTPVKAVNGIRAIDLPYRITGFGGDATYYLRLKAVAEGHEDSKWVYGNLITALGNQQLDAVAEADITATDVTLRFEPGLDVTQITLAPGDIVYPLTPGDISAGAATVTGLSALTTYTASLKRGTGTVGRRSFTTDRNLTAATLIASTDDLEAKLEAATAGQMFKLQAGTYVVDASIDITKTILVAAADKNNRPVIKGAVFNVSANAGLTMENLVCDGMLTGGTTRADRFLNYNTADDYTTKYDSLCVNKCDISEYKTQLIYINKANYLESITFNGCLISNVMTDGGDFFDIRSGTTPKIDFTANTVYNCAPSRDVFRFDNNFASGNTLARPSTVAINISSNTFYNVANGNSYRFAYVRVANNSLRMSKNIISTSSTTKGYTDRTETNAITFSQNNYHAAPCYWDNTATGYSGKQYDASTGRTTLDPGFINAATGNFTVSNKALIDNVIGDPRWLPAE